MALGRKYPALWNFCTGVQGAFVGLVDIPSERDMVKIRYVPINGIKVKITNESYPKHSIIRLLPPDQNMPGVPHDLVVVIEDSTGTAPLLDQIDKIKGQTIAKYKEEKRAAELEAVQQKFRAREAKEESSKQIAKDLELRERAPMRREEGMFPRDRFRDYMVGDEFDDYRY
jgi:hypothetical protein